MRMAFFGARRFSNLSMTMLQNKTGQFVAPNDESFKATVASSRAEMDPKNLEDSQNADSYPILTLILIGDSQGSRRQSQVESASRGRPVLPDRWTDNQHKTGIYPIEQGSNRNHPQTQGMV